MASLFAHFMRCLLAAWLVSQSLQVVAEVQAARDLPADVLLLKSTTAAQALAAVERRRSRLLERERGLAAEIEAKTLERMALALPESPESITPPAEPDRLQAVADIWQARRAALKQLQVLLEAERTLVASHREIALKLTAESQLLNAAEQRWEPLAVALKLRIEAAELTSEQLDPAVHERLGGEMSEGDDAHWTAEAARDEVLIALVELRIEALAEIAAQAQQAEGRVLRHLQEELQLEDARKAFEGRDLADLNALLGTMDQTWAEDRKTLAALRRGLDELDASIDAQESALSALAAPTPAASAEQEADASELAEAERALSLAEATLAFRRERQSRLEVLVGLVDEWIDNATDAMQASEALLEDAVQLRALEQVIEAQNDAGQPTESPVSMRERLLEFRDLHQEQERLHAKHLQRRERLETLFAEAAQAEQQAMAARDEQAERVQSERRWNAFTEEVRNLEHDRLLSTFEELRRDYGEARKRVQGDRERIEESRARLRKARSDLADHKDPLALDNIHRQDEFRLWHEGEGIHLRQDESETDPAASVQKAIEQRPESAVQTKGESAETAQWIAQREEQVQTIVRYLAAMREQEALRAEVVTAHTAHSAAITVELEALGRELDLARRLWGAATMLQIRAAHGEIDAKALPGDFSDWASRDRVIELQASIDRIERELKELENMQARPEEGAGLLISPLQEWRDILKQQISQLNDRRELERTFVAMDNIERDEFEQKRHDRRIQARMDREQSRIEGLLSLLVSHHVVETDQLLRGYYERLTELEDRADNLEARKRHTQHLVELSNTQRPLFERLEQDIQEALKIAEIRLDVHKTRIKAALQPSQAAALLEELKQRTGVVVNAGELPRIPSGEDEQALQEARAALVGDSFEEWAQFFGLREWLAKIQFARQELGTIDTEIDQLKDHISSLNTRRQELQYRIARLTGHAPEQFDALPEANRPRTPEQRAEFFQGEIGILREERQRELNRAAAGTFGWLLAIPLIAFASIRAVSQMGRRRLAQLSDSAADKDGDPTAREAQEERVMMLFNIFSAGWRVLVIVLAVIYMLKALGVDVLPLIASAGVLGLAIAFGAQQLVRDFLSGFFILLENQFRPGERTTVNGIHGKIVKVTPRLTVIRERSTGSLHFMPNGSIAEVSNFARVEGARKVFFPVDYDTDQAEVIDCVREVAEGMVKDPKFGPLITGIQYRGIEEFQDYAILYSLRFFTQPTEQSPVAFEFRRRLQLAFGERGIEMPVREGSFPIEECPAEDGQGHPGGQPAW